MMEAPNVKRLRIMVDVHLEAKREREALPTGRSNAARSAVPVLRLAAGLTEPGL